MRKNRASAYIVSFDKTVSFSYLILCVIGILVMLDITSMQSSMMNFTRHMINLVVAWLAVIIIIRFGNFQKLRVLNPLYVLITIGLLVAVLVIGSTVKGATRQINLVFFNLQPSFLARLALIFFFAGFLEKKQEQIGLTNIKAWAVEFAPPLIYTFIIFLLIILERHMSTLVIGGATLLGMLVYAGIRKRFIAAIVIIGVLAGWMILKFGEDYRSSRIQTYKVYNLFTKDRPAPSNAPEEYQVHESLTALTSGSLFGTGIGRGRAKHYYLPEARTDYIYTVIGEEFGFIGAIIVLALHALLFFRAFKIANSQENVYYKYLCAGLAMNIFLNTLVNTGVAMSILPATGNTLPFISYGGTALLTDSVSVGIILNISAKRRQA